MEGFLFGVRSDSHGSEIQQLKVGDYVELWRNGDNRW